MIKPKKFKLPKVSYNGETPREHAILEAYDYQIAHQFEIAPSAAFLAIRDLLLEFVPPAEIQHTILKYRTKK